MFSEVQLIIFASTKLKYKFLDNKIDIDSIIDIENRK